MGTENLDRWVEESVVSWLFVEPHASLEQDLRPEMFADLRCRDAVKAFRAIATKGVRAPVDAFAVGEQMGVTGGLAMEWLLERFGLAYLERTNWRHWKQRLVELHVERKQRKAASELVEKLERAQAEEDRDSAVAAFQRELTELPDVVEAEPANLWQVMRSAVDDYATRCEKRERGERSDLVVSTGIEWLDSKLNGGWPRGAVSILAGRTSHGKSTIAQIAAVGAMKAGAGVHYFCFEDGAQTYGARMLAQAAGLTVGQNFSGARTDMAAIDRGLAELGGPEAMRRFLFETDRRPLDWLIGRVDRNRGTNRTEVVFVDYLAMVPLPGRADKHHEVDQVVTRLQQAAIEQGVAYVLLHQLNRTFAGRQNKQPMLSDLRDSGSIEERAATVVFAYRPNVDDGADDDSGQREVDDMHLVLAKNKNGPRNCLVKLRVDFSRFRILRDWEQRW